MSERHPSRPDPMPELEELYLAGRLTEAQFQKRLLAEHTLEGADRLRKRWAARKATLDKEAQS